MTTLRQIVTDALRENAVIGIGVTPEAVELDEGFRRLTALIKSFYGMSAGELLKTVSFGKAGLSRVEAIDEDESGNIRVTYVPDNVRLAFNTSAAETVYLNPNPQDGARFGVIDVGKTFDTANITINGNGRMIDAATSVVLSTEGLAREWFYRADLGGWVKIDGLTVDSESPFPSEFDDYLVTILAARLHPRHGVETKAETMAILKQMKTAFQARYRQTTEVLSELGLVRLTGRSGYFPDDA